MLLIILITLLYYSNSDLHKKACGREARSVVLDESLRGGADLLLRVVEHGRHAKLRLAEHLRAGRARYQTVRHVRPLHYVLAHVVLAAIQLIGQFYSINR